MKSAELELFGSENASQQLGEVPSCVRLVLAKLPGLIGTPNFKHLALTSVSMSIVNLYSA